MTDHSDALAQIYALILSAEWGCNNPNKNKDADCCLGGSSFISNRLDKASRGDLPTIDDSIANKLVGSQENGTS